MPREEQQSVPRPMPQYECHKKVRAVKIRAILPDMDGSALITTGDEGCGGFVVSQEFIEKHRPQPGGYYVIYDDGYESYSPAAAFEEGYTRVTG